MGKVLKGGEDWDRGREGYEVGPILCTLEEDITRTPEMTDFFHG